MVPVLNIPFRLIAAYNPQRFGVLDHNLQPTERFTFRFAVGTTVLAGQGSCRSGYHEPEEPNPITLSDA